MSRSRLRPRSRTVGLASAAAALAFALVAAPVARGGDAPDDEGTALTVYSSADAAGFDPQRYVDQARQGGGPNYAWQVPGFAVVKEVRDVDVPAGGGELRFTDVAAFIDPTTVSFSDLTAPGSTTVLEQAFRFDLASADHILARYVGKTVTQEIRDQEARVAAKVEGTVLSVAGGTVVLQTSDGLRFVPSRDAGLRLPSLPDGLVTKPTLVWKVASEAGGRHRVRTTYQTSGLTWRADYNLVLDATDTHADVGAWVTMLNLSGASYANARLKLVAGDVQQVAPRPPSAPMGSAAKPGRGGADAGFEEKSFFEYHLYTLPRRTDVPQNATQQLVLFPTALGADVQKVYVYYGLPQAASWSFFPAPRTDRDLRTQANTKVDVYVRFKNEKANRLGMPLPKGKVRVFKRDDADGTLEFVGEDLIDHTPKDETVLVRTGQAFDVVGDRAQTTFEARPNEMTEGFMITLRNHKATAVKVVVKENLYRWSNWEILAPSDPWTKKDVRTIVFEVDVPPDGEKVVTYKAHYWGW